MHRSRSEVQMFYNRNVDDLVRTSDRTLNVLVVIFLAAFALGSGAYYWGQMNPRTPLQSSDAGITAPTAAEQ
jgi:hypothetical protein